MAESFEVRGVIEGFYGTPWSDEARRWVLSLAARHGMNAYVYAPKDDPYHRSRWREPYPDERLDALLTLHGHCREQGVRFGFAVSPGLDFDGEGEADRRALWKKLEPFVDAGVDWFVVGFDDVPLSEGAGHVHGALAAWLRDRLPDARIGVVPTDYVGSRSTPYLDDLATALPAGTDLFWTGETVVPDTITADQARARVEATGGFPLVVWDNYPVNDAFMEQALHLGPVRGRDPDLAEVATGVLANPMVQPFASSIPLLTVAAYLRDPATYDPEAAWHRAIDDVATELGVDQRPLEVLAHVCYGSRLSEPHGDPFGRAVTALESGGARDDEGRGVIDALRSTLDDAVTLADSLPEELRAEAGPWAEQAAREAEAGRAALRLLGNSGGGDPWSAVLGVMGMLLAWTAARRSADKVAFGPRFACYPAIVQGDDGRVRVDGDAAIVEDANAVDRLCRLALHARSGRP